MLYTDALVDNCAFNQGDTHCKLSKKVCQIQYIHKNSIIFAFKKIVGIALPTYFKTKECSLIVDGSLFSNNMGTFGGAIDISHYAGDCLFSKQ